MPKHRVIYDGECALCRRLVRWLRRLDWLRRLEYVPSRDVSAQALDGALNPARLNEALHCVTADGRVHAGADALRFLGLRLPLLCLPACVLYLPGALPLARRAYRAIAARRHLWNDCARGECPPARG